MVWLLALVTLVIVPACSGGPAEPSETPTPLTVTRLATGAQTSLTTYSGLRTPERTIVRDQAAWRQMWTAIYRNQTPEPPLPVVDFTREMVVVAALGEQPNGGYTILIASASETSSGVTVETRTLLPGSTCGTPQVLTQPVDAARMPRRDTAVVFSGRLETQECR